MVIVVRICENVICDFIAISIRDLVKFCFNRLDFVMLPTCQFLLVSILYVYVLYVFLHCTHTHTHTLNYT